MKRALLITLGMLLTIGGLVGGAWVWQESARRDAAYFTDGDSIKTRASSAPLRDILWKPAKPLAAPINSPDHEYEPRITADGQTLYVVRGRAGENADIYESMRTLDGWTDPQPIAALSTSADELGPQPSRDGSTLYFYSDRVGGLGGFDLWRVSKSADGTWDNPENLGPNVNTPFNDYGPALSPDEHTLYFASNQPRDASAAPDPDGNWPATLREQFLIRKYDLFASEISERGFGASVALDDLNTADNEGAPAVSPIGDFLYFASDRPEGYGGFDLYRARLLDGAPGETEHLGRAVNSEFDELDPALAMGGFELLFSSNRPPVGLATAEPDVGADIGQEPSDLGDNEPKSPVELDPQTAIAAADDTPLDYNIFGTTSREVFRQVDEAKAAVNWLGLWNTLWPLLLLLLLLLALLLLLRRLWANERFRLAYHRLSLLARCILVSILIHLLLASLLAVWSVSNQIGEFLRESSGTKVALISRSGDSIASQIQGQITEVEMEVREPTSLQRLAMDQLSRPLPAATTVNVERTNVEDSASQAEATIEEATPAQQIERPDQQAPDSNEAATVETPESAAPARVTEAQMQASQSEASDVQSRPVAANAEATAAHVTTETTNATVQDNASAALAQGSDAPVEQSFTPDASPTTPDLNAAPAQTATPGESREMAATESEVAVPQAQTVPVERTAIEASQASDATAIVNPQSARQSVDTNSETLATVDESAADAQVAHQESQLDPSQVHVAAARPDRLASLTDSTQAAGSEAALTAQANPTEARRTESTSDAPSSAAAVLETTSSQSSTGDDAPLATLAETALQSNPQPEPAESRAGATTALDIEAARAGEVASPTETMASAASEATAEPHSAIGELSARDTKSLDVEMSGTATRAVAIDPGSAEAVDDSTPSATHAAGAQVSDVTPSTQTEPTNVALPDIFGLVSVSTPTLDVQPEANSTLAAATEYVESGSPELSRSELPDAPVLGLETPLTNIDVAPAIETVDSSRFTPALLPELFEPSALPDAAIPSEMMPDLDLESDSLALALPTETAPRPNAFPQRAPEVRSELVEQMGGSEETENSVALALEWLARNQSNDGRWSGRNFPNADEQGGKASFDFDSALTGLALMAFLGADHTHLDDGPYREIVEDGINWLVEHQEPDGDLRRGETMYSQGIATIALAEAYAMTGDPVLEQPIRRAIAFIEDARNEDEGGWRYEPGQVGDTSVLGWQVMALVSARRAGIEVRDESIDGARDWLDVVELEDEPGLYAYQPGMEPTMSMTAESMFVRRLLGMPRNARRMHRSADFIDDFLPDWEDDANTYGWYYATLALYQHGGESWEIWNAAVMPELLAHQQTRGHRLGSWDPEDQWSVIGGRVYQTAICALTLEVYYRYLPTFVGDADDAAGLIRGVVVDDTTDLPIPNASVRLDVPDSEPLVAFAGPDGSFEIYAPELPSHVAISASSPGYIPSTVDMEARDIENLVLDHQFRLSPVRADVIAIEENPDVHHLGNDDFSGSVNSQFQNDSEGLTYERTFVLSEFQVPPHVRRAEIRLLHKGTQADNPISINGHRLDRALNNAPRNGSFEEFVARFPARWLEAGENTVRIRSVRGNSDLDDFEFVNIRIHLTEASPSR